MAKARKKADLANLPLLTPTGYAEKILDCPEWVQGSVALEYFGIPADQNKRLFDGLFRIYC